MNKIAKRSRQFFRALFAKMTPADHALVRQHLSKDEQRLFYKMDQAIQKHCVNVSRTVINNCSSDSGVNLPLLIKAALLHDIGKAGANLTVFDRVLYVVMKKFFPDLTLKLADPTTGKLFGRFRHVIYTHLAHGELGADMARQAGLDEPLVYLLKNHHRPETHDSPAEIGLLIKADELN